MRCFLAALELSLLSAVQILLLSVSLSGSMSSCHCSGQKSAQTPIVLQTDLQLQAVLPNISALCHVFKTQCHTSAMISRCCSFCFSVVSFVVWKLKQPGIFQASCHNLHFDCSQKGNKKNTKKWTTNQLEKPNSLLTLKEDMPQRGSKQFLPRLNGATC